MPYDAAIVPCRSCNNSEVEQTLCEALEKTRSRFLSERFAGQ